MKLKLSLFIIIIPAILFSAARPTINLKNIKINESGNGSCEITFVTSYKGLEPELFANEKITLFNETNIIKGILQQGQFKERDFLFSGQNIDIDGDGKFIGNFKFIRQRGKIYLNGKEVFPTEKKIGRVDIFAPMNKEGKPAILKMGKTGLPFHVRHFNKNITEVKLALLDKTKPVINKGNSCLIIEVLALNSKTSPSLKGEKLHSGKMSLTDQKLVNDAPLTRYWWIKEIPTKSGSTQRSLQLKGLPGRFKLTVTYLFAISPKVVLLKSRALYFDKK